MTGACADLVVLPWPLLLGAAYGLAFGLQNDKIPLVRRVSRAARAAAEVEAAGGQAAPLWAALVAEGLRCTYCAGVHAGWIVWLLARAAGPHPWTGVPCELAALAGFALASGVACYGADELIAAVERSGGDA